MKKLEKNKEINYFRKLKEKKYPRKAQTFQPFSPFFSPISNRQLIWKSVGKTSTKINENSIPDLHFQTPPTFFHLETFEEEKMSIRFEDDSPPEYDKFL